MSVCSSIETCRPAQRPVPTARLATMVALACCAMGAAAQTSPYFVGASQTLDHQSNLLRLTNSQAVPDGYRKADTVFATALQAGFDRSFSRQRAYGNLAVRANRYSSNSLFNNTGYSLNSGLDWQTIERLSGTLSASANRNLQLLNSEGLSFPTRKNIESVETVNASANLGLVTQYSLALTGGHRQAKNSLQEPAVQSREFKQDNVSLGLNWRPSSATTLGVAVGTTQGRYPKFRTNANGQFEADRFKRNDVDFSASLRPTGASTVEAHIGIGRTHYDLNQQRDFSGITGSLVWAWQATGKLRLNTTLSRDTGQDSYATAVFNVPATSDYSRTTSALRTALNYDFSAKVSFVTGLTYYDRSLVRTIDNPFLPLDAHGKERTTVASLGARWVPLRFAQLGCDYTNESRRGSGQLTADLRSNSFSCFGQITLQ